MKSEYSLSLAVPEWVVTREHLQALFELLRKRFPKSVEVVYGTVVKFGKGTEKREFKTFQSFDDYILRDVYGLKKELISLEIKASHYVTNNGFHKYVSAEINFNYHRADFYVSGTGDDSIKDWSYGFYTDLEGMVESFKPTQALVDSLKELKMGGYRNTLIIFDYRGDKKSPVPATSIPSIQISHSQIHLGKGDNVGGNKDINLLPGRSEGWFSKITNNQTFAIVVGGIILAALVFYLGIHQ